MRSAPSRVETTVEAKVRRADGRLEDLGVVARSSRRLSRRERLKAFLRGPKAVSH